MKLLITLLNKEVTESIRTKKILILSILFIALGIMNPLIAKITPWMMELLSDSLGESGVIIIDVHVDANTSWVQFFKNIPLGFIVFVLMYSQSFTKEYQDHTLLLLFSKGLDRSKVLLSKLIFMITTWTLLYGVTLLITYSYNAYFWDNSVAIGLYQSLLMWYIFGIFVITLIVLLSTLVKENAGVLIGIFGILLTTYLIGLIPVLNKFMPTTLMDVNNLLVGKVQFNEYLWTIVVTLIISLISIIISIPLFNKKEI